ncbi:hypothetical protein MB02_16715 [Croceicoccus estronivorus]|uniref:nuclear transport factor 2 family protein n=1 Tax=Croceicoccus estronivorus TaxID=1172626 RepID=UPI00082A749E|nr:nuclear transport factor 2 family protein [Croceicoccus estronivorus]OCC22499.1 hypothetical protein MB02_16715 [Croceicoccus estronivorus]
MNADLDSLLAIRAIEQNIIRFARAMDERDWHALETIMASDVVADLGTGLLHGPEAIVGLIRHFLDRCGTTQHLVGNILVTVSGDTATSRAYVHDSHLPADEDPGEVYYTLGDYNDRWERKDGCWRMVERIKHNRANVGSLERVFGLKDVNP